VATALALVNLTSDVTGILPVNNGGTGSNTASGARANLSAAQSGSNSDITSLSGLTTALSVGQGGTGVTGLSDVTGSNGVSVTNGTGRVIGGSVALSLVNVPNSALANSTIGLTSGTAGTDVNVSGTPASLGGSITLNIPTASATRSTLIAS
jgi:hypothetical protein